MGRPKNFSRQEVLEKAIPLFWKQGFADTSLQDLEQATGVNKSGLYSEFESKEDLFLASLKYYIDIRNGVPALTKKPLGFANIETLFKTVSTCHYGGQRGCFATNSMRELAVVPDEAQELLNKNHSNLKKMFAQNIAAENSKIDAEAAAEVVATFFSGFCLEQNMSPRKATATKKIEALMQILRAL